MSADLALPALHFQTTVLLSSRFLLCNPTLCVILLHIYTHVMYARDAVVLAQLCYLLCSPKLISGPGIDVCCGISLLVY